MIVRSKISCLTLVALLPCCSTHFSRSAVDDGVPLTDFKATNGKYFPETMATFFEAARDYTREHATVTKARADVQLIQVKALNTEPSPIDNEANLSWSADGAYLAFERIDASQRTIRLKSLSGEFVKDLAVLPRGKGDFLDGFVRGQVVSYNAGLSWSHDSTRYAYMSNAGVGQYNIFVGAVGGKDRAITKGGAKNGYASWNPKKREIAFVSSRSGHGDIYSVEIDSGVTRKITQSDEVDLFPVWTPDGTGVVYCSGDALNHDIYYAKKDYFGNWQMPTALVRSERDELRPTISADGKFVAFYGTDGDSDSSQKWNIYVVPFEPKKTLSGEQVQRTVVARNVVIDLNTGPAWSPDGKKILYVKRDANGDNPIQAIDLMTGKRFEFSTGTKMNHDILISRLGVISFRAQVGAWERVFVGLTNQGLQLQPLDQNNYQISRIRYENI